MRVNISFDLDGDFEVANNFDDVKALLTTFLEDGADHYGLTVRRILLFDYEL